MENTTEPKSQRHFSLFDSLGYCKTDVVYLHIGAPGSELLRMICPIIESATTHQMQVELEGDAQLFQYGMPNGNWQSRSFLATFLSEEYGSTVHSQNLFLTAGASSGLLLLISCLLKQSSIVFVEDLTYFYAIQIFKELGKTVIPVKTDEHGLIIDELDKTFKQYLKEASFKELPLQAMLYTVPVFHNPTGFVLPEGRCQRLVQLARKYGVTVVCDDAYNLLHYDENSVCPKRLYQFDERSHVDHVGNIISNGTFSKILAPGLRVGWIEAPEWAIDKLKNFSVLRSGGGISTYTSGIITSLLALGKLKTHLQKLKTVYKTNMKATAELLKDELPPGCKLKSPALGGYFLWIELPENIVAKNFLIFSETEYKVSFMPGSKASVDSSFENFLRICISFYPLDVLLSAVRRLCEAISDYQSRLVQDPNFGEKYSSQNTLE